MSRARLFMVSSSVVYDECDETAGDHVALLVRNLVVKKFRRRGSAWSSWVTWGIPCENQIARSSDIGHRHSTVFSICLLMKETSLMMPLEISDTFNFTIVYSRQIKTFLCMKSSSALQVVSASLQHRIGLFLLSAILSF
jgi:hypothetical protein